MTPHPFVQIPKQPGRPSNPLCSSCGKHWSAKIHDWKKKQKARAKTRNGLCFTDVGGNLI